MRLFPVTAYPWPTFWTLLALTVLLPLTLTGVALYFAAVTPDWLLVFVLAVSLGFLLSITIAMLALLVYTTTRNEVTLRDGTVHIKGGAYHERVPLAAVLEARVVDLRRATDYRPVRRENGIRLPGYQAGWFTLANGSTAFVLRTARRQAVYIQTDREFAVLLGVREPRQLVRQLTGPE